jgi:hypothetical protein
MTLKNQLLIVLLLFRNKYVIKKNHLGKNKIL